MPLRYAVLAPLSRCYSPPGGRLPTCYSPGRHSTCPRRDFRVRLACVRHAASVDSEPGSNSQLFNPHCCPASFESGLDRFVTYRTECFTLGRLRPTLQNHCYSCSVFKDRLTARHLPQEANSNYIKSVGCVKHQILQPHYFIFRESAMK